MPTGVFHLLLYRIAVSVVSPPAMLLHSLLSALVISTSVVLGRPGGFIPASLEAEELFDAPTLLNATIPAEVVDQAHKKKHIEADTYGKQLRRDIARMEEAGITVIHIQLGSRTILIRFFFQFPNSHFKRAATQSRTPRTASKCRVKPSPAPTATSTSTSTSTTSISSTSTSSTHAQAPKPSILTATTAPASYSTSTSLPPLGFNYGTDKVRGVNLVKFISFQLSRSKVLMD